MAQRLSHDLRTSVLETGILPIKLSLYKLVAGDGVKPPEAEAKRFTVFPAIPTV